MFYDSVVRTSLSNLKGNLLFCQTMSCFLSRLARKEQPPSSQSKWRKIPYQLSSNKLLSSDHKLTLVLCLHSWNKNIDTMYDRLCAQAEMQSPVFLKINAPTMRSRDRTCSYNGYRLFGTWKCNLYSVDQFWIYCTLHYAQLSALTNLKFWLAELLTVNLW